MPGLRRQLQAVELARHLRTDGHDFFVGRVDAYSTLGWFPDPVRNTFVAYPDIDLAETIFHELSHRVVYADKMPVFEKLLAESGGDAELFFRKAAKLKFPESG